MKRIFKWTIISMALAIPVIALVLFAYAFYVASGVIEDGKAKNLWFQNDTLIRNDTMFVYRESFDPYEVGYKTAEEFREQTIKGEYIKEIPHSSKDTIRMNGKVIINSSCYVYS